MKPIILDSKEFYTNEWADREEIVLDEEGFVYDREIKMYKDKFYKPVALLGKYRLEWQLQPDKYKYVEREDERPIMCLCGNKRLEVSRWDYTTTAKCPTCGNNDVVHSG